MYMFHESSNDVHYKASFYLLLISPSLRQFSKLHSRRLPRKPHSLAVIRSAFSNSDNLSSSPQIRACTCGKFPGNIQAYLCLLCIIISVKNKPSHSLSILTCPPIALKLKPANKKYIKHAFHFVILMDLCLKRLIAFHTKYHIIYLYQYSRIFPSGYS